MKKNKNAFTLIELLAVIVILAIIALIATPIILGIVEDAKKDAFLRSVELVISTTDIDITSKTFEEEYTYTITDGDISNLEVGVKNTQGMNGSIKYDINGNESYAIHNGVYCVTKTSDMSKAEISDYKEGECNLTLEVTAPANCFETEDLADGGITITDYYYYEDDDYETRKECPKEVVIPSTINGKTVKAISAAKRGSDPEGFDYYGSFLQSEITSIKFPSTLESIGMYAFLGNNLSGELDLRNLTNLTSIEYGAFQANKLTSVKLPSSIETIEIHAFSSNKISGELDLRDLINLKSVSGFRYNEITSVKLPNSVESIGESAFSGNAISGELDLSNTNITSIGESAFEGEYDGSTNQITSIKLPTSIESIGDYVFAYNAFTGELDLSNTNVASIGQSAFQASCIEDEETYEVVCSNQIISVKFPSSIESIGFEAFYNQNINSMTFYGRSDLTGLEVDFSDCWADGYDETNGIHFINE